VTRSGRSARPGPGLRHNAGLIARREYRDRVRTRTFVAATAVLAVVAVGLALAPIGLRYLDRGTIVRIGFVAEAEPALVGSTIAYVDSHLNKVPEGADPAAWERPYRFEQVATEAAGRAAIDGGKLRGLVTIERGPDGGLDFQYVTSGSASSQSSISLEFATFGAAVLEWNARAPKDQPVPFVIPDFTVASTSGPTDGGQPIDPQVVASRSVLSTVLIVLIFVTLTVYGMWVATSVAAEKSTRVMELLISAATPRELLVGKVVGVGGAGLTQYAAIIVPASLVVMFQDRIATVLLGPAPFGGEAPIEGLTLPILGAFLLFFLLGFILYALLYAAAGSLVSRQEDVQQLALPLSLVSMASYIIAVAGIASIGSTFMLVMSFVPFSSPFVMLSRIMMGRVEPWEVLLSVAILVASSVAILGLAARIYATGVVLYGQRPGFRDFIRAARSAAD
jgi:ABC-2 type transport system permease protein